MSMKQTRREMFQALCALPAAASLVALPEAGAWLEARDAGDAPESVLRFKVWSFAALPGGWLCTGCHESAAPFNPPIVSSIHQISATR